MTHAIFVTVRTGSTRLPNKALLEVSPGTRAIDFLLRRLTHTTRADLTVLCTTTLPEDDILAEIGREHGISVFRGSVEDKLERWLGAARENGVDLFVTADGDDLLCDPGLIDAGLEMLADEPIDFVECPDVPCGAFTYGIRVEALSRACDLKKTTDTEMMWVYFKETGIFRTTRLVIADAALRRPTYRLTLDYPEDLEFFRKVIAHFKGRVDPSLGEIVSYLDTHPEVLAINAFRQFDFLSNQARRTHLEV